MNVLIYGISDDCHVKSRIKEKGQYTLIGQLTVRLDQAKDHYWANVGALGDETVRISAAVLGA
jgi:predicted ATP-dependent Lon-type protease